MSTPFDLPLGEAAPNLGEAPVPPPPARPLGPVLPPPAAPMTPEDSAAWDASVAPLRATRVQVLRQLAQAQEAARGDPDPAAAVALKRAAEAQNIPLVRALAAPGLLSDQPPTFDYQRAKSDPALTDLLTDPTKRPFVKGDEERLLQLTADHNAWVPTGVGSRALNAVIGGDENFQRANLLFEKLISGGALPPAQQTKLDQLDATARLRPTPSGFGEEALGMTSFIGRSALAGAAGAATLTAVGAPEAAPLGAWVGAAAVNIPQMVGANYGQYLDMKLPHEVAAPAAIVSGTIGGIADTVMGGLFSKVPALKVLTKVPGFEKLSQKQSEAAMRLALTDSKVVKLLGEGFKDAMSGGAGMALIEASTLIGAYAAAGAAPPGQYAVPTKDDAWARIFHSAVFGAGVGAMLGGTGTLLRETLGHVSEGKRAETLLQRIYKTSDGLTLPERNPEVLKGYGDALAKDGTVQRFTAPVEALDKLFQGAGLTEDDVAQRMPEVAKSMAEARTMGTRVEIGTGDFLAHIRPLDKGMTLLQELGVNDSMSPREAKELAPQLKKAREQVADRKAREDMQSPEGRIVKDLEEKLRATDMTIEGARVRAEILASGVARIAERAGKDPWQAYLESPLHVARTGAKGEPMLAERVASRFLALTPEQRATEFYRDSNTGLPNELAHDVRAPREGGAWYFADPQGLKYINDQGTGHEHGDLLYRSHARELLKEDPNVVKAHGGFIGWAPSEAEARGIVERANARTEAPGFTLEVATGKTPEAAKAALTEWKKAAEAKGERAVRGSRPFGSGKTPAKDIAFGQDVPKVPLTEGERAAYGKYTGEQGLATYINHTTKVLTGRGWAVERTENPKAFVLSGDVSGVGILDKQYSPAVADKVMEVVEHVVSTISGDKMDAAHPHGDEIMAQHDSAEKLREYGRRLTDKLERTTFEVTDPDTGKTTVIKGIAFAFGVGKSEKEAEHGLDQHKEALATAGKRDRKDAGSAILDKRITVREADESSLRRARDLVARDVAGGKSGADQEAHGLGRLTVPGFERWYSKSKEGLDLTTLGSEKESPGVAQARGSITFDPAHRDFFQVTLTGRANLSTFLHEGGHYLLELMRKYEPASPEIAADLRTLETWAGVKPGEAWSVPALEKFARGFETYLGEGKAPSAKLAGPFAMARVWMLHVYRTLTNLKAPLTDEVRGVMDRMVATEDEISTREAMLGLGPITNGPADGMPPEFQKQWRDAWRIADATVRDRMDREAIRAAKLEKGAEYKRISEEVKSEVAQMPVYNVREYLATGKRLDGGLMPEVPFKTFDADMVRAQLGRKLGGIGDLMSETGGADPNEVAPYFGFRTGADMLEALRDAPSRSHAERQLTKEEMTKRFPEYGPDPAWLERKTLTELHENDAVSHALELNLRAAHTKANLPPPVRPVEVAHEAAVAKALGSLYPELNPKKYIRAEEAAAKAETMAYAKKDFPAAVEAARQRIFNRAMWKEATDARKSMEYTEVLAKSFSRDTVMARMGKADPDLRDATRSLLTGLGFMERGAEPLRPLEDYLSSLEAKGMPVVVDPMLRDYGLKEWKANTFEESLAVKDALHNLSHLASEAGGARVAAERIEFARLATVLEKNLAEAGLLDRLGVKGAETSKLRQLRAQASKPASILADLDGGKFGEFSKLWMGMAEKAQFEKDDRQKLRIKEMRELDRAHAPEEWRKIAHTKYKWVDGEEYTGAQLFAAILNLGTQRGRDKLMGGYTKAGREGWTYDAVISRLHEIFPQAGPRTVWDWADAKLKYISRPDLWNDLADVKERLSGVRPEKEASVAIPTPGGGSIEGGYYPLKYDYRIITDRGPQADLQALDAMQDANPLNVYAANGFTKGRTGFVAPILLDPAALAGHLYEVDHFITNAEGVVARHKLLNYPPIAKLIVGSIGREYYDQLRESNNFIAADGRILTRELLQMNRLIDTAVFHNSLLTMGGNFLSGFNQIIQGVPATVAYLGPGNVPVFAKSLVEFARNPWKAWERVGAESGEIKGMDMHFDRDLRIVLAREAKGEPWSVIRSRIASVTMTPIIFGQKVVNVVTYMAAKDIALREGKSEADAILWANNAVRQSQASSTPMDLTAMQRSKDSMMRVLTALASYTFTLNDMVMPRHFTSKEIAGNLTRATMMLMTGVMVRGMMAALLPDVVGKQNDNLKGVEKWADEKGGMAALLPMQMMMEMMGNVPVVGRPVQSLVTGREPHFASWLDTGVRAIRSLDDLPDGMRKSQVKAVVDTIGLITGLPTRHVLFAPGEFTYELMNGNIDSSPWKFLQELALVRPGQKGNSR